MALGVLKGETPKVATLLHRTLLTSSRLPVRLAMFLLAGFVLSDLFGIEAALGAFAAGFAVGLATRGEDGRIMREKIDAIAFGCFVPFFFVTSGMRFDLAGLLHSPRAGLLVPVFLGLLLIVRGAPAGLYWTSFPARERLPFALSSATTLPMVVAITGLAVRTGRMASGAAAALVGAGLLSVTIFPTVAVARRSRNGSQSDEQGARPSS